MQEEKPPGIIIVHVMFLQMSPFPVQEHFQIKMCEERMQSQRTVNNIKIFFKLQ